MPRRIQSLHFLGKLERLEGQTILCCLRVIAAKE
jgi:hypothetical protein